MLQTHDPVRELLDLVAVHSFYVAVLEAKLKHKVPIPHEPRTAAPGVSQVQHSLNTLRRWLAVLDLAISPVLIRDALKESLPHETAEAMLRYYVDKGSHSDADRDKADCVSTFLYRNPKFDAAHFGKRVPMGSDEYHFVAQMALEFEAEIYRILGDVDIPQIHDEHLQLVKEFEFLHHEVEDFRTFDQLMDSGIVQRVRDIKQSFGNAFYHPDVLANVAVYNAIFGVKFDSLFKVTTEQIKHFAARVQQEGASIMSRLDGEITVKHLAEVDESKVINQEYGRAQENFRKISKFKKVMDTRGGGSRQHMPPPAAPIQNPPAAVAARSTIPHVGSPAVLRDALIAREKEQPVKKLVNVEALSAAPMKVVTNSIEEGKIRGQLETIQTFLRVADKNCCVIPLTKGALNISFAEGEALRAEFGHEKSFRADLANIVATMVAMMARLTVEQEEFRSKQSSSYLWKPHADSMTYIMTQSNRVFELANGLLEVAEKRGLEEKAGQLKATMLRFRMELQKVAAAIQAIGSSQF